MLKNAPKIILITGASSGIGAALARYYAGPGISLHISGRDQDRLRETATQCRAQHATVHDVIVDVGDMNAMSNWIALATQKSGVPDLVIANAGISSGGGPVAAPNLIDEQATRNIMAVNIAGVLNTLLPVIPIMLEQEHGQIAIISSIAGSRGLPSAPAYSASKAAVKAYGEALRPRLAKHGVQLSVVMPGFVESRITDANDYSMPMIMDADKAAKIIARGLAVNRARIAFPLPMAFMSWLIACLPPALIDPVLARLPSKS
jgi:short-subunit dehydrogenase